MQYLIVLLLFVIAFITSSCGWHLHNNKTIPAEVRMVIFNSNNPNDLLNNIIRNKLLNNGVKIIDKNSLHKDVIILRILTSNLSLEIVPILLYKHVVEYRMILSVSATIFVPGNNVYPISIKVFNSFFNDQQTVLAIDTARQVLVNNMYDKAATELIHKLLNIKVI